MSNLWPSLVLSLLLASPASAAHAVLEKAVGQVLVRPQGEAKFEPAAQGSPLLFGDEVKTLADSAAHVVFPSGDAVLIKENSHFRLQGSPNKVLIRFTLGEFLIGLKRALSKGQSFRVRTPAAVAAVRGTLFWGLTDKNKDTVYACFGHTLAITAQGKTVDVGAGQTVQISYGQPPAAPEPADIPLGYLDTFALDGSLSGLKELVDLPER